MPSTERSVLLPEKFAKKLTSQCSRTPIPPFEKTWRPTKADIQKLESRLDRTSSLLSGGSISGKRIANPGEYYRQYVGIVIGGRKLIYVNAFCRRPQNAVVMDGGDWHKDPITVCDGGDCFWGALFDPISGEFSHLYVNGIA